MKKIINILVVSMVGLLMLPSLAMADEAAKVNSGGNDLGIEFEEDYVPATSKLKPSPDSVKNPVPKPPIKKIVLPQTGEGGTLRATTLGLLLILGVMMLQQKRRGSIEKE